MGNGSGIISQKTVVHFDPFDPMANPIISDRLRDAALAFESSPQLRATFVEYLQTGTWIDTFVRKNKNFSNLNPELLSYLSDAVPQDSSEVSSSSKPVDMVQIFQGRDRIQSVLVAAAFPIFLASPEFKLWFAPTSNERMLKKFFTRNPFTSSPTSRYRFRGKSEDYSADADEETSNRTRDDDAESVISSEVSGSSKSSSDRTSAPRYVSSNRGENRHISLQGTKEECRSRFRSLVKQSLAMMDSVELDRMLANATNEWLGDIVLFVETLPVAVTVAKAHAHPLSRARKSFPLFYCNRKYSQITDFALHEIVDQPHIYGLFFDDCSTNRMNMHDVVTKGKVFHCVANQMRKESDTFRSLSLMKGVRNDPFDTAPVYPHHASPLASPLSSLAVDETEYIISIHDNLQRLRPQMLSSSLQEEIYALNHLLNLLPCLFE